MVGDQQARVSTRDQGQGKLLQSGAGVSRGAVGPGGEQASGVERLLASPVGRDKYSSSSLQYKVKEVVHSLAHEVLQHGGLAGGLAAHHRDLGQVDGVGHPQLGEDVLHPVHDGDEGLHPLVASHDEAGACPGALWRLWWPGRSAEAPRDLAPAAEVVTSPGEARPVVAQGRTLNPLTSTRTLHIAIFSQTQLRSHLNIVKS